MAAVSSSNGVSPDVFSEAAGITKDVQDFVTNRITSATATAQALEQQVVETINALQHVNLDFDLSTPPAPPTIDGTINGTLTLPTINATSFGSITSSLPTPPSLTGVPLIGSSITLPDFSPTITGFTIPDAPVMGVYTPPVRPTTGDISLPVAPDSDFSGPPALVTITIPDFVFPTLPTFDNTSPNFEGTAVSDVIQWSEPKYEPEIIDEALDAIRRIWAEGSGLPPAVELAMVERALSREDAITAQTLADIDIDFSSRGFTMPSGVQVARYDAVRQDSTVKKLGLNRELTIQFAQFHIENVKFAIQQALAAEQTFVNIFTNAAQRTFEIAKFQIQTQLELYNAQVSLFNARQNAYSIRASVYKTQIDAALSQLQVYKAQVEGEIAKGQLNEQTVKVYQVELQAFQTKIDIYKAKMEGASIQSGVVKNQIDAYRADVEAYSAQVGTEKVRFEAYDARVRGESAKAQLLESEAKAYAALIEGKSKLIDVDIKKADVVIQTNSQLITQYTALLEAEKARLSAQLAVIQTGAQAYTADTQRYIATTGAETAKINLQVTAKEAELRTNVSFYEARVKAYTSQMELMIHKAELIIEALKATGQLASTVAAGAMAGISVGASLSGQGGVTASGSKSYSGADSFSTSYNHNFEGE